MVSGLSGNSSALTLLAPMTMALAMATAVASLLILRVRLNINFISTLSSRVWLAGSHRLSLCEIRRDQAFYLCIIYKIQN